MAFRLISLDLDGTLLDRAGRISPANREALERASARGIRILINSGRVLPAAESCVAELSSISLVAGCNGAIMRDSSSGRIIHRAPMGRRELEAVMPELEAAKVFFCVYGASDMFLTEAAATRMPGPVPFALGAACRRFVANDVLAELERRGTEAYKVSIQGLQAPEAEGLRARLSAFGGIELSSSSPSNLEIGAEGVNKGGALDLARELYALGREETLAIGDSENDLPMLAAAGLSVAMGNAEARVIAAASRVTASNELDGVAAAIRDCVLA
jgi:Cof subfamily protein (haloacid dehalogenase superfamily)